MLLRCEFKGEPPLRPVAFTPGNTYTAKGWSETAVVCVVLNDNGHERVVGLGGPSMAHCVFDEPDHNRHAVQHALYRRLGFGLSFVPA